MAQTTTPRQNGPGEHILRWSYFLTRVRGSGERTTVRMCLSASPSATIAALIQDRKDPHQQQLHSVFLPSSHRGHRQNDEWSEASFTFTNGLIQTSPSSLPQPLTPVTNQKKPVDPAIKTGALTEAERARFCSADRQQRHTLLFSRVCL